MPDNSKKIINSDSYKKESYYDPPYNMDLTLMRLKKTGKILTIQFYI